MKRAILFLNLGGPETPRQVKPFLRRLFEDPEIIRVQWSFLRRWVAWFLATAREKQSKAMYEKVGGGSPIRRLTDEQAVATEEALVKKGRDVAVRTAFTCSDPLVEDVLGELYREGVRRFLAFPLYPQYSLTTTKGAFARVRAAARECSPSVQVDEIRSWPVHPQFLKAHAELITKEVSRFSNPRSQDIHLVFSAHSIPKKLVTDLGDPYKKEVEETVHGVIEMLHWDGPSTLAWQSKLGPVKWLGPSTLRVLMTLCEKKTPQVLVVPISFVTDHIETLYEIDQMLTGALSAKGGIGEFRRTPGLNNHPRFIEALTDLALSSQEFWD